MKAIRQAKVGDEMRRILAGLISNEMKDPRIPLMTSVTEVQVSGDLSFAKCYISVMGSPEEQKACLSALKKAQGFLRTELGKRMRLRVLPELQFILDDSIERGDKLDKLIDQAMGRS